MVAGIQGLVTASGFRGVDAVVIAEGTGTNRLAALSAWACPGRRDLHGDSDEPAATLAPQRAGGLCVPCGE